jgi:hypothetical protein
MLRELVPVPTGDFQDLASWREIVAASVLSVHRHHADLLLVPMTLVRDGYRRQVMDTIRGAKTELLEVFLDVPADELRRRIEQRVLSDDRERDAAAKRTGCPESAAPSPHGQPDRRFRFGWPPTRSRSAAPH